MSYVLDALRRAEAERHSGALPTVHAPTRPAVAAADAAPSPGRRWLGPLLLLSAAAALAWLAWSLWPAPQQAAQVAAPVAAPVTDPMADLAPAPAPRPVPPMPVQRAATPAPLATAEPPAATREAAADTSPLPFERLPESLRRQLPAMAFGGATDSPVPSSRMLIVNGRLLREGDEVAPGLLLERIALRSATMRFQGRRFDVRY